MSRRIFTFVAAHPVDTGDHETPRVRVLSFIAEGPTLAEAFAKIAEHDGVVDATEVFGVECLELAVDFRTALDRQEQLAQWESWARANLSGQWERPWSLLKRGPESFADRNARIFAQQHPQFA